MGFRLPNGRIADVSGVVWWTTGREHRLRGFGLRLIDTNPDYDEAVEQLVAAQAARF